MSYIQLFSMKSSVPSQQVKVLLTTLNVEFEEVDVQDDEEAVELLDETTGQWAVPALIIWGTKGDASTITHRIVGYEPEQIKKAVKKN